MKKNNILSLTFCIFGIFFGYSSFASSLDSLTPAHVTPAITFKNQGGNYRLASVIGYPQGKPTIIFYPDGSFYDSDDGHFGFPKLYKTDHEHLAIATTVNINQFEDLSKTSNISKDFLISELPLPNTSIQESSIWRALYFKKVIWFDKTQSFYALGILESTVLINNRVEPKTKKIIILESTDGIHWTVNRDGSDTLPISSDEKVEIAGSGPESNPTLIMSIDRKIYTKHLKSSNATWELSSLPSSLHTSTATTRKRHSQQIIAYKDKFLLARVMVQTPNNFKPPKISADLIDEILTLPPPTLYRSIDRSLFMKKIIWFDKTKSYYALYYAERKIIFDNTNTEIAKKIFILESSDGLNWTISGNKSEMIPVSENGPMDIVGRGSENDPILSISINGKIYDNHLKAVDSLWEPSTLSSLIDTDEQQLKIKMAQEFFLSDDGYNWKKLTFDSSDVIGEIHPDGNGELINAGDFFGLHLSTQKDVEGFYTATVNIPPNINASGFIGKIVIDEINNKINLDKKLPIHFDLVNGICSIIHIPNSSVSSGKYYMNFYTSEDRVTKGIIMTTESLEDSTKIHFTSIDYEKELFFEPDNQLINFNNEPYIIASLSNSPNVDTIFYHIDSI